MTDRPPQRPQAPNWAGLSRSAALWVLVILVSLFLFQIMSRRAGGIQEFAYTGFQTQLDAGNIQNVIFIDGRRIEGEFKAPVRQEDGRVARGFSVLLPIKDSEQFLPVSRPPRSRSRPRRIPAGSGSSCSTPCRGS